MKKYRNMFILLLLTLIFFMYAPIICWDSANYVSYVQIFEKIFPMSSWDVTRGIVFPLIIFLSNILFGKTTMGLLIVMYLFYLVFIYFVYKILDEVIKCINKERIISLIILIIFFNPIIFGYYHTLLTEFVAITLSIVSCYFSWKYINIEHKNIKKIILYILLFSILSIFGWHLKQPYVSCALFPFIISNVLLVINKIRLKIFLRSFLSIFTCLMFLFISILVWNKFLSGYNIDVKSDDNPTEFLSMQLLGAIDHFEVIKGNDLKDNKYNKYLNDKSYKNNILILIKDNNKIIDYEVICVKNNNLSTFTSLGIIFKNFFEHPLLILDSYLTNYLSTINIYSTNSDDLVSYKSNKKIDLNFAHEIKLIGYRPYSYNSNIFYMPKEMVESVKNYEQYNQAPKLLNYAMKILGEVNVYLFKFSFLILPIIMLVSFVFNFLDKKNNKLLNLIIILLTFSFLHALLHAVTGAIIDRYIVPVYITCLLGIGLFFYYLKIKRSNRGEV